MEKKMEIMEMMENDENTDIWNPTKTMNIK